MKWSGRRGSNPRPTAWEAVTLPLSYSRPPRCLDSARDFGCGLPLRSRPQNASSYSRPITKDILLDNRPRLASSAAANSRSRHRNLHGFDDSLLPVTGTHGAMIYPRFALSFFTTNQCARVVRRARLLPVMAGILLLASFTVAQTPSAPAPGSVVKPVGTVKAISGNTITLATDSGSTLSIAVQDSTRMLRTLPGKKDLQGATPCPTARSAGGRPHAGARNERPMTANRSQLLR